MQQLSWLDFLLRSLLMPAGNVLSEGSVSAPWCWGGSRRWERVSKASSRSRHPPQPSPSCQALKSRERGVLQLQAGRRKRKVIKHEKMLQQNAPYQGDSDINTGLKAENPASLGLSSRYKLPTLASCSNFPSYLCLLSQHVVGLVAVMARWLLCPSSG